MNSGSSFKNTIKESLLVSTAPTKKANNFTRDMVGFFGQRKIFMKMKVNKLKYYPIMMLICTTDIYYESV